MPERDELKIIKVLGDKHAKEKNADPAYQRYIHAQEVTFTCPRCNQEITEVRFPGHVKYCSSCSVIVKREKTRARVQAIRQRKKALPE
jgi:hypothetical protein